MQGTTLRSTGGDTDARDSFTNRTKMVLSSLQTSFEAAAEQGSVKKRRLSSDCSQRPASQVVQPKFLFFHVWPMQARAQCACRALLSVALVQPAPSCTCHLSGLPQCFYEQRTEALLAAFFATEGHVGPCLQVSMNALIEGKGRKDASRWFFEMLVLKTRNYVTLKQHEPFGDIYIAATSSLLNS